MTNALVSTQWAADHLNDNGVRIVEVDVDTAQYDTGHIPGAVAFNWETQLQDQVARDIIGQGELEHLLSAAGIGHNTRIVLYGDHNNWFAAYALWLLKYYGHEQVSLIDGGRKKWLAENRPITTETPTYPVTGYQVAHIQHELRADRDYIRSRLGQKGLGMVDVRSGPEYVGDVIAPPGMSETAQRGGHIPGAVNIPWSQAVAEDGTFKSRDELLQLYGAQGINGGSNEVITYCRIGERSSHTWFALKYLIGLENVRNYDGSWTEWGNLIGNPIKKGAEA